MTDGYWPWWGGALALAGIAIGHWLVVRAMIGVSSLCERIIGWRAERAAEQAKAAFADADFDLEAAMLAATAAAFGVDHTEDAPEDAVEPVVEPELLQSIKLPVRSGVTFLVSIVAGGLLASALSGGLTLQTDFGSEFHGLFGHGYQVWAVLFFGGLLVGFGTRLAGGCTSGHGLVGCARLQMGSLVATASFLGTAIVVSLLLSQVLS